MTRISRLRTPGFVRTMVMAVAVAALATAPALGQGGRRGDRMGGPMRGGMMRQLQPDFLRRDIELIRRELELDDVQQTIVEALILDYGTAFTEAAEAMREAMSALRPRRDEDPARAEKRREVIGEIREIARSLRAARQRGEGEAPADAEELEKLQQRFEELRGQMEALRPPMPEGEELEALRAQFDALMTTWQRDRTRLRQGFMTDLQAILTEPQVERWPAFERTLRREKTVGRGQLSGEDVDLFLILRDLRLDEHLLMLLEEHMDGYAIALDRALAARESFMETARSRMMQAMFAGDVESAQRIAAEEAALRVAVRAVNEQYVEQFAAVVDEATGDQIRTRFRSRAYPRIYRRTSMHRSFEVARQLEDLDDETRLAIEGLEQAFETELASANARLVQITREREPLRNQERIARRGDRRGRGFPDPTGRPEPEPDPLRDAFQRRGELEQAYRGHLEALLTEAQVAQLPELRPERGERRGRGGGFGPGGGERRQQIIQRFDTDGDGELNETERAAAREAMRNQRGGQRDRGGRRGDGPAA